VPLLSSRSPRYYPPRLRFPVLHTATSRSPFISKLLTLPSASCSGLLPLTTAFCPALRAVV
jgi:hypothetical protein